jgi:enoyl-[acyl-carrier protein] reductase I
LCDNNQLMKTRAASGITAFEDLLHKAQSKAPTRCLVSIDDVGIAVAFLGMPGAKLITGETLYIDGGYHIIDSGFSIEMPPRICL